MPQTLSPVSVYAADTVTCECIYGYSNVFIAAAEATTLQSVYDR